MKSDVWSLGCILYNMVYQRTPFQKIHNQIQKLQALLNPSYPIEFPELHDKHLLDVLKVNVKFYQSAPPVLRHFSELNDTVCSWYLTKIVTQTTNFPCYWENEPRCLPGGSEHGIIIWMVTLIFFHVELSRGMSSF